jgi:hypothetical protein
MKQLGYRLADIHEILYLNTSLISVHEIQILLTSGRNNEYLT